MNKKLLEDTLAKFLKAWEDKDVDAVLNLMSGHFEYFETPLEQPLTKIEEVRVLWNPVKTFEAEVQLAFNILSIQEEYGLFRIQGSYKHTYEKAEKVTKIDRIFLISIDNNGKITKFIQWRESKNI